MHTGYIRPDAVAYVKGSNKAPQLFGEIKFYRKDNGVLVVADVSGLPGENESGFFAFHIHEGGDCSGAGFPKTGGHYNPKGVPHPKHAGDLPPLLSCDGEAYSVVLTNRFRVKDIIGRTVVIHSHADDFNSQPAGNPGDKIACGVISMV